MTDTCSCGHGLDEHRPHYGQCLAEGFASRFCSCRGFERNTNGDNE